MKLPPFHWWRTVFFLIPAIGLYTIGLGILSLASSLFDSGGEFAHRCAQWWGRAIVWTTGVRITRRGELPPPRTSCIYVANHASIYDIPVLFVAIPTQLRLIAKDTLGYVPFIGWHLSRTGHLLLNRKRPGASVFKRMQRMVGQGASLLVFPEGSRSRDGSLRPFKGGIFLLAIENRLPVVPVSLAGMRAVMPRGRLMVCPAAVHATVHEPISTEGMSRGDARALAERVKQIIAQGI